MAPAVRLIIALEYEGYLSNALRIHVNKTYLRAQAGDVTLAEQIAGRNHIEPFFSLHSEAHSGTQNIKKQPLTENVNTLKT
jgi:hypothetical protein